VRDTAVEPDHVELCLLTRHGESDHDTAARHTRRSARRGMLNSLHYESGRAWRAQRGRHRTAGGHGTLATTWQSVRTPKACWMLSTSYKI